MKSSKLLFLVPLFILMFLLSACLKEEQGKDQNSSLVPLNYGDDSSGVYSPPDPPLTIDSSDIPSIIDPLEEDRDTIDLNKFIDVLISPSADTCLCGSKERDLSYSYLFPELKEVTLFKSFNDVPSGYPGCYIIYDPNGGSARLIPDYMNVFDICNFPQEARYWNIPTEGIPLLISCEVYYSTLSEREGRLIFGYRNYWDLVVTVLKKKKE